MLDEHHRHALVGELTQQAREALGLAVVLARRRLVEQQHRRLAGQGTAELDQPALPGRERGDPHVGHSAADRSAR